MMSLQILKALNTAALSNANNDSDSDKLSVVDGITSMRKSSDIHSEALYETQATLQLTSTVSPHDSTSSGRSGFCGNCGHHNNEHKHKRCRTCGTTWKRCQVTGGCNGEHYRICVRCHHEEPDW